MQPYHLLVPGVARLEKNSMKISVGSPFISEEKQGAYVCITRLSPTNSLITFTMWFLNTCPVIDREESMPPISGASIIVLKALPYHSFRQPLWKWNSLEESTKNLVLKSSFKNEMLKRIRPKRKEMFGINDRDGQKWINQLESDSVISMLISSTIISKIPSLQCVTSTRVSTTLVTSYCTAGNSPTFV